MQQLLLFPPQSIKQAWIEFTNPKDYKTYLGYKNGDTPEHFVRIFNILGDDCMARKSGKSAAQRPSWGTDFVNWKPTPAEAKAFNTWLSAGGEEVEQCVDDLALSGGRVSITWSAEIDAFTCAYTPRDDNDPNKGYTLSLKSGDWKRGIYGLAYYVNVMFKGGAWAVVEDEGIL